MSSFLKYFLIVLAAIGFAGILAGSLFLLNSYKQIIVTPTKSDKIALSVSPSPTPTPDPDRPYSVLLLGYGGGKHDGGNLTDSIIVARFEPKLKKITLISIPRDLWVPIPVNGDEEKLSKINAAYAIGRDDRKYPDKKVEFTGPAGGGQLSKYVISKVVGFPIDYFVALDFQGFTKIIDLLGGIDVKVKKILDDPWYPIEKDTVDNCGKSDEDIKALTATMSGDKLEQQFPCRYEHLYFGIGVGHMDGQTALKFARSRHSPTDGGDFNRAARQRLIIDAVKERVISLNFISKIIPSIKTLAYNMQTDIDINRIQEFISKAPTIQTYNISSLALTDQNVLSQGKSSDGQFILIPRAGEGNWQQIHDYILDPTILTPTVLPSKT